MRGGMPRLISDSELSEEDFFHFLRDGIPYLSHFGVVSGTDVFRAHRVQGVPQITVGVSVQSGLMDLSISSTGMTSDELLALLDSYQKKKKYYRLRSGDYIDLEDSSEIDDITDFFHSLDLLPTEAIKEKMHLPLYRALYIDRMLEEHENIISSRDRRSIYISTYMRHRWTSARPGITSSLKTSRS